jgi:hypothetical protein
MLVAAVVLLIELVQQML